jgi:hypothetical protein
MVRPDDPAGMHHRPDVRQPCSPASFGQADPAPRSAVAGRRGAVRSFSTPLKADPAGGRLRRPSSRRQHHDRNQDGGLILTTVDPKARRHRWPSATSASGCPGEPAQAVDHAATDQPGNAQCQIGPVTPSMKPAASLLRSLWRMVTATTLRSLWRMVTATTNSVYRTAPARRRLSPAPRGGWCHGPLKQVLRRSHVTEGGRICVECPGEGSASFWSEQ